MSNTRCQALSWLLLPMTAVVVLAVTGVTNETLLLYLWTVAVILAHIHYGVSVVRRKDTQKSVVHRTDKGCSVPVLSEVRLKSAREAI